LKGRELKSIKTIKRMCKMKTAQLKFANVILVASSLFVAIGCQSKTEKAALDKFKATAQIQEQNKEIVREVINAIDSGDLDKPGNLLSDDFALYSPGSQQPWRKEALYQARNNHFAAFPDWIHKIEIMVAEGDKVAVKLTQYGTQKNQYKGIEPTGKSVMVPATHIMRIVNGKVKDWWALEDNLGLMTQLGMELKSKENK
jgi:predicted ester cyclase